jgi:hypothetical protein
MNPRKDKIMLSIWLHSYEEDDLNRLLDKENKTEKDLATIGDIISSVRGRGDFNRR